MPYTNFTVGLDGADNVVLAAPATDGDGTVTLTMTPSLASRIGQRLIALAKQAEETPMKSDTRPGGEK